MNKTNDNLIFYPRVKKDFLDYNKQKENKKQIKFKNFLIYCLFYCLFYVSLTFFLTAIFINIATQSRGYFAFGGEYFLIFIIPLGMSFIYEVTKKKIKEKKFKIRKRKVYNYYKVS